MATRNLTEQLLALPLAERLDLALALWESVGEGFPAGADREAIAQAARRDAEMDSGLVTAFSHQEVMQEARRAIGCD